MALPPGFVLEQPSTGIKLPPGFELEKPAAPPEKQSAFRQIADVPLGIAKGAVQGVRMIADSFGAGSDTSKTIKSAETYLADLMSAQAKNDQQEISRIMKDAEDKGVLDQVKAGIKAFTVAPVDTLSSALGTAAPVIAGALGAKLLGAGALATTGVSALTGAGMGAGTIKGSIYETTKQTLKEAGASEQDAEARAKLAQEYGGKNLDQILLGTVLGGAAAVGPLEKGGAAILARRILGKTGAEGAEDVAGQAAKGAVRRRLEAGALEAVPEAVQAGQEQVAQNIALQREGFDVPTFRGAVSAATLEGLAGAGLGAAVGGGKPAEKPAEEKPAAETTAAPEVPPVTPEVEAPPVAEVPAAPPAGPTPEELARIQDEHETAIIEGLIAQDVEMARAKQLAEQRAQEQSEAEFLESGIKETDRRVREGRIFARVQDLIDRNIPFASTAINDINQKFGVINEAPLTEEERARIENIMGMVSTFTNFVNLPVLAPKPMDPFAENQQMEALIRERTERGQAQPVRTAPAAPSPSVQETPVSQGAGEGPAIRPPSGIEPSVAEDSELVTQPAAPAAEETEKPFSKAERDTFTEKKPGERRNRFVVSPVTGLVFDRLYSDSITPPAFQNAKEAVSALNSSRYNQDITLPVSLGQDENGRAIFTSASDIAPVFLEQPTTPPEGPKTAPAAPTVEAAAPAAPEAKSLGGERAQVQAFEQDLRTKLNKFGLKDAGLKILGGMTDSGSYAAQIIKIAADAANPVRTLRHEAIHALRELGFFTDAQWSSLSKMAKDTWVDQYLKQRNVDGKPLKAGEESRYDAYMREYNGDMEKITEEAVSDAFADFDATKPPAGLIQALLKRMKDLFQSIKSALTKVESPEQIFGKVEKGELKEGAREDKGEAKSLRDRATANFKRWFGDSKVVDERGEPLVVYHGTVASEPILKFGGSNGIAGWFAESPELANIYAQIKDPNAKDSAVYPAYVSLKKPLVLDFDMNDEASAALKFAKREFGIEATTADRMAFDVVTHRWFVEAAAERGYDGLIVNEQGVRTFAAFRPEQIKSAIGNNGDYSLTNADIRKSIGGIKAAAQKALQKQPMPEKGLGHVKQDLKNLAQPIFFAQNKTILDRIDGMKDRFWQRVAQNTADQFRTIKEYSPLGYMQARLSKSVDGGLEGLLFHGQVFDDGGALNIKAKTKGMMDILKPLGNELDSYLMWVALNRESNLPEEKRSKIANMDQLVARRDEFSAGELNGKPRVEVYRDVLRQMNQLNKSVLDIALAKGLINQKGYDQFSGDIYYVPFYKKMEEDGDISGAQTASGLTSQDFSKELKGSDKPFGDLMENVVRNWSHILSASMKNAAAKTTLDDAVELGAAVPNLKVGLEWKDGKVYSIKSGKPIEAKVEEDGKEYAEGELRPDLTKQDAGMAKVMVDGQPMYFKVTDDLLMDSISSIGYLGPKSKFILLMRDFKNMLQYGVTASPIFKVNNLIRDSVAAMAVSDLKKNPVANVLKGISLSDKDSPTYISALAGGAIFNFGSAYEGDQATLIKRLLDQGVPGDSILDTKEKITKGLKTAWDAYQNLGDKSEAANRLSLYQQMRDKGMTHLQASFMARDLLDFSMQGSWPAFRFFTQVVPFMNARIQGLYKLGRDGIIPTTRVLYNATTGKEIDANDKIRAAQFATITTAVMLASALLYLSFKDDEDFKKRDAWDRDNFWWIKLPGMDVALRVPKPFEVGAFGTLVERSLEQILDEGAEGKQFGESLARTLWDTFALNPTPQMFKPLVDIYSNKDSFSGAPIESAGLERLSKQERATDQTSPLAIALGGLTSIFPEKFQLSPVQMDYMLKGYFGWLGAMASVTSTYAVMPFKEGEYPDARWLDRASLGLARELPAPQSAYVTQFYNASKEISQAYADMRHYREMGDAEKVQEILEEKGDKIALAKFYDKTAKNIANVRKQIRLITNDKDMDGAEKKEAIERMKLIMSDLAKQAEEVRKSMKQ